MIIEPSAVPIFLNPTTSFHLGIVPQQIYVQHQITHKNLPPPTTPFKRFLTLFQKKEIQPGILDIGLTDEIIRTKPHLLWHPNQNCELPDQSPDDCKVLEFENKTFETMGIINYGNECTVHRLITVAPEEPWKIIKVKGGIKEYILCGSQSLFNDFKNPRVLFDTEEKISILEQISDALGHLQFSIIPQIFSHGKNYIVMEYICGPNFFQLGDKIWGLTKEQIKKAKKELKTLINEIKLSGIECDCYWKKNYVYRIVGENGLLLQPKQFRWFFVDP